MRKVRGQTILKFRTGVSNSDSIIAIPFPFFPPFNKIHGQSKHNFLIQGDSGGEVDNLVGDSIGHCEKKKFI